MSDPALWHLAQINIGRARGEHADLELALDR